MDNTIPDITENGFTIAGGRVWYEKEIIGEVFDSEGFLKFVPDSHQKQFHYCASSDSKRLIASLSRQAMRNELRTAAENDDMSITRVVMLETAIDNALSQLESLDEVELTMLRRGLASICFAARKALG